MDKANRSQKASAVVVWISTSWRFNQEIIRSCKIIGHNKRVKCCYQANLQTQFYKWNG